MSEAAELDRRLNAYLAIREVVGLANNAQFPMFEKKLKAALRAQSVRYTMHWSKNSGIDSQGLLEMYESDRVQRWRLARARVFDHDTDLMRVFSNAHLERAGLA